MQNVAASAKKKKIYIYVLNEASDTLIITVTILHL